MEYKIALAGNPNVGKTSIYNRLTGAFEHVGNWHGVTVSKAERTYKFNDKTVALSDLPGLYSLTVYSAEEAVSRDELLSGVYDITVCVCDANNLARNLYLAVQLIEAGVPLIIAVNMVQELNKSGRSIDLPLLEKRLGVPVIGVNAIRKCGTNELSEKISSFLDNNIFRKQKNINAPYNMPYKTTVPLLSLVKTVEKKAQAQGLEPVFAALKVLENDEYIMQKLELSSAQKMEFAKVSDSCAEVAAIRYAYIDSVLNSVITRSKNQGNSVRFKSQNGSGSFKKRDNSVNNDSVYGRSKIDKITLNKYLAFPIFLSLMAVIFFLTFGLLGKALSQGLDYLINSFLYNPIFNGLTRLQAPDWLIALVCEGIISGVGGILTFLPQIVLLFLFLALLEDSGYISRVAFMTDGLFRKIGLSGRAGFTMLMGFGCSASAVLTSRGLEDENMRKKTILVTPFFSCSARLPVYSVIAATYFSKGSPLIIFAMYLLGIAVSVLIAFIMERLVKKLKSGQGTFIMEMPPYRLPTAERVYQLIKNNVKVFLFRVGTVIFALNVTVWVLSNFSFAHGFTHGTEFKSILQHIGSFIAPVFKPLGFSGWEAVTSLLSGIVAKEIVISSIESMGGVGAVFIGEFAAESALSFMTFTLLYIPCLATLAAIRKESGVRWMLVCMAVQFITAYVFSFTVYNIAVLFKANFHIALSIVVLLPIIVITLIGFRTFIKNRNRCPYGCKGCLQSCGERKEIKK